MVRLQLWQWIILISPLATIITFLLVAAGTQIHAWGLSWIWAIFSLVLVGWRWLLVRWTKPAVNEIESVLAEVRGELEAQVSNNDELVGKDTTQQVEKALQKILDEAQQDRLIWEDWQTFWQRCQNLVVAIAHIYNPEVKYPLLNIYIPQVYGLIRGTVDDMDQWMGKLSPVLNQVTVGQAYQAYEVYRKLEPSARKFLQAWNWAQWLLNPVAAVAKQASQGANNRATQELLVNVSQLLREAALRNLCKQAIALYTGSKIELPTPTVNDSKTQTLREIITQAEPLEKVKAKPLNILLAGRTGAGKSSVINTLFQAELAAVDVLPSTDKIQSYHWELDTGEALTLCDTPGYEQVQREDLRNIVLDYASNADLLLLVTPALDPALQMDVDFLEDIKAEVPDLPMITIVSQVDRLRPIREWQPPYNWESGEKPKEIAIREATEYRRQLLGNVSNLVLPIVTNDGNSGRSEWGIEQLSRGIIEAIAPAKQLRLARFLRNQETRTVTAAKIIDNYTFQMTTTQGLAALLKSPVLQFISTLSTGSPTLAYLLAEKIPVEQLPIVIGKLQMAYELFPLFNIDKSSPRTFDLLSLWPLLLENSGRPDRNAWAFGHAFIEYLTQDLTIEQLQARFYYYLQQS
ncbi:small GTP-binding protein domain protein [Richelia sinica FACHB-800]|uniref:Small GTP-binding protein domain protein n=1 Tax=Richelia sinica FACHB-800 TaxID=1357546 RepID=A0A975T6I2_9NOST|nr:GTPase [Richelia sinica]MBD2664928.1 50S ribosome-binding GTPase [Richelia sinica FACHB-800]QXE22316.1 small GTP-binding protein domain protein [Richelia sinica FACHB-800]